VAARVTVEVDGRRPFSSLGNLLLLQAPVEDVAESEEVAPAINALAATPRLRNEGWRCDDHGGGGSGDGDRGTKSINPPALIVAS